VTVVSAPTASSVSISDDNGGSAEMGDTLTGNYTYADADSDNEGTSIFRWLRNGTAISFATKSTYNIIASDANASLKFEVTPIAAAGTITGSDVTSSAITIAAISKPLNDTGTINCGDYAYTEGGTYTTTGSGTHNNNLDCSVQATVPTQTTDGYNSAKNFNQEVIKFLHRVGALGPSTMRAIPLSTGSFPALVIWALNLNWEIL
jgi:hypothetical protein